MKLKNALIPLTLTITLGGLGVVAFHPGVAYAAPRLASGPATPLAQGVPYTIDPMHTSVSFEITHMGLSSVHGRLNKFTGKLMEDGKDLTKSTIEFTGEIGSLDTAVPPRDKHLMAADYFDSAKYPTLSFKSTKVEKAAKGYVVTGDLTLKGKTKSVSIPFEHFGPLEAKEMGPARVGVVAQPITIKRSDFGIGSTDPMPGGLMPLSNEVVLRMSFEATKDK